MQSRFFHSFALFLGILFTCVYTQAAQAFPFNPRSPEYRELKSLAYTVLTKCPPQRCQILLPGRSPAPLYAILKLLGVQNITTFPLSGFNFDPANQSTLNPSMTPAQIQSLAQHVQPYLNETRPIPPQRYLLVDFSRGDGRKVHTLAHYLSQALTHNFHSPNIVPFVFSEDPSAQFILDTKHSQLFENLSLSRYDAYAPHGSFNLTSGISTDGPDRTIGFHALLLSLYTCIEQDPTLGSTARNTALNQVLASIPSNQMFLDYINTSRYHAQILASWIELSIAHEGPLKDRAEHVLVAAIKHYAQPTQTSQGGAFQDLLSLASTISLKGPAAEDFLNWVEAHPNWAADVSISMALSRLPQRFDPRLWQLMSHFSQLQVHHPLVQRLRLYLLEGQEQRNEVSLIQHALMHRFLAGMINIEAQPVLIEILESLAAFGQLSRQDSRRFARECMEWGLEGPYLIPLLQMLDPADLAQNQKLYLQNKIDLLRPNPRETFSRRRLYDRALLLRPLFNVTGRECSIALTEAL